MKRTAFLAAAASTAMVLVLSACSAGDPSPSPAAANLRLPVLSSSAFVQNFNPFSPANQLYTKGNIYEPLYIANRVKGGEETPWLADSYEWSEDLLNLTFTLHEGVKWSDGEPFTADDVVFTYNLGKDDPALDLGGFWTALGGTGVEANGNAVTFTFKSADLTRFPQLVNNSFIFPEHVWESIDDPANFENPDPVGTGPFTEVEDFSAQSYSLNKNPSYWRDDVAIPGLSYTQYASQDAIVQALKTNTADWGGVVIPDIEKTFVSADPEHNAYNYAPIANLQLCVNTTLEAFDDPAFRKALSRSINREAIQNNAVYGYARPAAASALDGQFPDVDITADDPSLNEVVTYDIDAAKDELKAAGYTVADGKLKDKSGNDIVVKIPVVSSWFDWVSTAQIIADGFKEVGIDASVDPQPDFGAWFEKLQTGNFTVSECGGGLQDSPELWYYSQFSSDLVTPIGDVAPQNAFGRWSDPRLDEVIAKLRAETDPSARSKLYAEMQMIYIDALPYIPLNVAPYWQAFTTHNYTGWPTEDNNYSIGLANDYNQLLVFTQLKPVQ